jgi:RNA polymerase sigma-70 factor (ECF subfamily)
MPDPDTIYEEYGLTVYRYVLSLTHDRQLAEELTQDTFCKAVFSLHKFEGKCKISVWLCQIAKHLWYQHLEKQKHPQSPLTEDFPDTGDSVETRVLDDAERIEVYRAVHLLEEPYREVMLLRVTGDFTFKEIGEIMGKTENWARVTYFRAKEKVIKGMKSC